MVLYIPFAVRMCGASSGLPPDGNPRNMGFVAVILAFATVVDAAPKLSRASPGHLRSPTDTRIINGQDAAPCQFPHQVSLQNQQLNHFCGGSIIGSEWVVTAAHCAQIIIEYSQIYIGSVALAGTNSRTSSGTKHSIIGLYRHPWHNRTGHEEYDYATLRVNPPFQFTNCVKAISLGTGHPSGMECFASGWGKTSGTPGDPRPENLKFTRVTPVTDSECKKMFPYIDEALMCTMGSGGNGICSGYIVG
ncbi:unnamed protein product [Cyprideis torosa]|uniref:Uncharacterized protein n=1 Tax=Cyprideis torosa TaxID=163714 RepID=A0A7R8WL91_9CRUS|nr:unnamed protein product [Cyprideis torosa]CAG0904079.1 unnamed protein product [Cyprideis torosa]